METMHLGLHSAKPKHWNMLIPSWAGPGVFPMQHSMHWFSHRCQSSCIGNIFSKQINSTLDCAFFWLIPSFIFPLESQNSRVGVLAQCLYPFYLVIYCLLWNPHHCVLASFRDTDHSLLCHSLWCEVLVWAGHVLCPLAPGYHATLSPAVGTHPSPCHVLLFGSRSHFIYLQPQPDIDNTAIFQAMPEV